MAVIKTQFSLRISVVDYAKLKKLAQKENRSVTNMIDTMIKQKITEYEQEHGEITVTDEEIGLE